MTKPELQAIQSGALLACKEWLNVREAAQVYGVSDQTIYGLIDEGELPYSKGLRRILIARKDIEALLNKSKVKAGVEESKAFIDRITAKRRRCDANIERIISFKMSTESPD